MRMKWGSTCRLSEVKRIKWFCRLFITKWLWIEWSGKLLSSDCGFTEFICHWLYSRFSYPWDSGTPHDKCVTVIRYSRLSESSYISS